MSLPNVDHLIRRQAFDCLDGLTAVHGDALPWQALARGFEFRGRRVPLLSQQGIFKPAVLEEIPLSIRTAPERPGRPRPYDDQFLADDLIVYRYRGKDPLHRDNVGLREAWKRRAPLIYFFGIESGWYAAAYPAFVVGDDPARLRFTVQVDAAENVEVLEDAGFADHVAEARRGYLTSRVRVRLHQQGFRFRVLRAYRDRCAVCRLRHRAFLDAAHIIPDAEARGIPVVSNGLSLCKLHHAAYDRHFLGIRPDYVIELREDLLREEDGPMLVHGLQEFQDKKIVVPRSRRDRPDPKRLEERFERFLSAG
jgi:putative restriction endonuclease